MQLMTKDPIAQLFQQGCEQGLLSGMVLAAGTAQRQEFLRSFGTMTPDPDSLPMPVDSIFDAASLTKPVAAATACARCVERGILDPDAPATTYLPDMAQWPDRPITSRALATHYSGLPHVAGDKLPVQAAIEAFLAAPPKNPPFTHFEYLCRNFILLGWIAERCSGKRLDLFCEQEFFAPLKMNDTRFGPIANPEPRVVPTFLAPGIISDQNARHLAKPVGNAGLFSTAEDLGRFCRAILDACRNNVKSTFTQSSIMLLTTSCSPPGMPQRSFGWDMRSREEVPHRPTSFSVESFGHSGWTGQSLWIDPVKNRYSVVLTNRTAVPDHSKTHSTQMLFRGQVADLMLAELSATVA